MRKVSSFEVAFLQWLACAAVGTTCMAACSLSLDYLQSGGPPDAGDANSPLPDVEVDAHTPPDGGDLPDSTVDGGGGRDATVDVTVDVATTPDADSGGSADVVQDGGPADARADAPVVPDGGFASCAEISVPLAATGQTTDFTINLTRAFDFTNATVNIAVYAPGATGGYIDPYVQNDGNGYPRFQLGPQALSNFGAWSFISLTVPATGTGSMDPTKVFYLGVTIEGGTNATTFEQPNTVVYIGEIIVTGATPGVQPFVFNSASTLSTTGNVPENVFWLNTNDSPLSGSNLVFDPTCAAPTDAGPDAATQDGGSTDASAGSSGAADGGAE
jgi:hypothetical protein